MGQNTFPLYYRNLTNGNNVRANIFSVTWINLPLLLLPAASSSSWKGVEAMEARIWGTGSGERQKSLCQDNGRNGFVVVVPRGMELNEKGGMGGRTYGIVMRGRSQWAWKADRSHIHILQCLCCILQPRLYNKTQFPQKGHKWVDLFL